MVNENYHTIIMLESMTFNDKTLIIGMISICEYDCRNCLRFFLSSGTDDVCVVVSSSLG